ncbi:geraniol 8-hydroxylase-like [Corylus avellana]|uniref:geraniol 8-hydroxylase-like n=1 Tax=Corylus avellana TaxID=13451 RepID=UPI00286C1BBB|nr:geraniol 8-hydroxylase-like [Corylus avellana]
MEYLAFVLLLPFVLASIHVLASGLRAWKSGSPRLPPGPKPFPIIGNILDLVGNQPHRAVSKLSKTYGPLMTLKLGSMTTIVISSPDLAKQVLQKYDHIFSGRTIPDAVRALNHHKFSMVWLHPTSSRWRNLRKVSAAQIFASQRLDSTQAIRRKKVQQLVDHVKEICNSGQVVDIGGATFTTSLNAISNTLFSKDLADYCSIASHEFLEIILGAMEEAGRPNVADYFPALRFVDPQGVRRRLKIYFRNCFRTLDGIINERLQLRASSSKGSHASSDVLDSLLDVTQEDNSELSRDDIRHLLLDLFIAGIDTTSSTVEWAMAELLRNPEKMAKARKELEDVLGKDEHVQESDISKLPYLQAIVKETLRLHPPAPFLGPHKAEIDKEVCGFTVPKNAQILVNVWAMGRDSSIWPNPDLFVPERFLEKDINFKGGDFELIPFGAGRRICPGLPLANRMVHLMLASLVHYFNWNLADELKAKDLNMSETFGITLHKAEPLRAIPIRFG